jgi:carbon-monoxide dehydrogenase small subunit
VSEPVNISVRVNGTRYERSVLPRIHLVDFLREELGIMGARVGCEHCVCGACTLRLNGDIVRGCLVLAVQVNGADVETIEGASDRGDLTELQRAFLARNALQCGYCTPGMLMTASELVASKPDATREQVRESISGNYCRCTGYHSIVDAICDVLDRRRASRARAQETA